MATQTAARVTLTDSGGNRLAYRIKQNEADAARHPDEV